MENPIKNLEKILWLDLEMTGLIPEKDVIIEVGVSITDSSLNEIESYESVIKQNKSHLDNMDKWNQNCHRKSGLIDLIPNGKQLGVAEEDVLHLIEKHFRLDDLVIIAGNCIYQDRSFIRRYMTKLDKKLYYRMLDITAWKIIFETQGIVFDKPNKHRALEDARESAKEFKFYLDHMEFKKPTNQA